MATTKQFCVIESGCDCDGVASNNCFWYDTKDEADIACEDMIEASDGLQYSVCTAAEAAEEGYYLNNDHAQKGFTDDELLEAINNYPYGY